MHNQRLPLIASFLTSTILFIERKEQNQNGRMKYQQHDDETVGLQISPPSYSYHMQSDSLDYHLEKSIPKQIPQQTVLWEPWFEKKGTVSSCLSLNLTMWLPNDKWPKIKDFHKSLVMTRRFTVSTILTLGCKSSPNPEQHGSVSQPSQLCLTFDLDPSKNP
jgi:hypothetical protein